MANPEAVRRRAQLDTLETELKAAQPEVDELRQRACGTVPVAEVHEELDRLGVPQEVDCRRLFLHERFTFLEQFLTGRRQKKGGE
jgi:hypothetical protein